MYFPGTSTSGVAVSKCVLDLLLCRIRETVGLNSQNRIAASLFSLAMGIEKQGAGLLAKVNGIKAWTEIALKR